MARRQTNYTPGDDILDMRSIVTRYEELKEAHEANVTLDEGDELTEDEVTELKSLKGFIDDVGNSDCQLILDSHFEDYAMQYAEDMGAVDRNASWPNNFIDWSAAADALKSDFSSMDWEGYTYW